MQRERNKFRISKEDEKRVMGLKINQLNLQMRNYEKILLSDIVGIKVFINPKKRKLIQIIKELALEKR